MIKKNSRPVTIETLEKETREGLTMLNTLVQALNKELRDHVLTMRSELDEFRGEVLKRLDSKARK